MWFRLVEAGQLIEADEETATHVSVEEYRALAQQNQRLYARLQREIRMKKRLQEQLSEQTGEAPEEIPRREIRTVRGKHYMVHVIRVTAGEAPTEVDVLAWAQEYARRCHEDGTAALVGRIKPTDAGWSVEILTQINIDLDIINRYN